MRAAVPRQHGRPRRPLVGRFASYLPLCLFAALPLSDPAAAQTQSLDQPADRLLGSDKTTLFVNFGLSAAGVMRPDGDSWLPVILSVQGGSKPFEGVVRAEFQQDATQSASIVTPVAATPGKTSVARIALPLPAVCSRVEFSLIDRSGAV